MRAPPLLFCAALAVGASVLSAGRSSADEPFRRGDVNADGEIDLSDAVAELGVLFLGTGEIRCDDAADANDDGGLDISDAITILGYLFLGTSTIAEPLDCGADPSGDGLGCAAYPPCAVSAFSSLVVVDTPARGAMLSGSPAVAVTGRVLDPGRVEALLLDGAPVPVLPDGRFTTSVTARHGLNVLRFTLEETSGGRIDGARSFLWAERYQPPGDATTARLSQGLVLELRQAAIDDRSRALPIDDFAHVALVALQGLDINSALPNPLFTYGDPGCACQVFPPVVCTWARGRGRNARFSSPAVSADLRTGGLGLSFTVRNAAVDISVEGVVTCIGFGPINGTVRATSVTGTGNFAISLVGGRPRVAATNVTATVTGLTVDIDLGILGGLASTIANLFSSAIADALESAVAGAIQAEVPPVLASFLEDLEAFSDALPGTPVTADLRLESLDFTAQRCRIAMGTAFTSGSVVPPGRGSILHPAPGAPVLPSTGEIALALSQDALNQLLHASWKGTAAPLDVTPSAPPNELVDVDSLLVEPLLPPVLLPGDGTHPLRLEIGDLGFDARLRLAGLGALDVRGYASAAIGAEVVGLDDRLRLELGDVLDFALEVTETGGDAGATPQEVAELLELVLPLLVAELAGETLAELALPGIDLGGLGVGLPPGTTIRARGIVTSYGAAHVHARGSFSQ